MFVLNQVFLFRSFFAVRLTPSLVRPLSSLLRKVNDTEIRTNFSINILLTINSFEFITGNNKNSLVFFKFKSAKSL